MGAGGTVTEGGSAIPGPRAGEGRRGCSGWRTRGWCGGGGGRGRGSVVETSPRRLPIRRSQNALAVRDWTGSLESTDADGSESGIDGGGEDGVAIGAGVGTIVCGAGGAIVTKCGAADIRLVDEVGMSVLQRLFGKRQQTAIGAEGAQIRRLLGTCPSCGSSDFSGHRYTQVATAITGDKTANCHLFELAEKG